MLKKGMGKSILMTVLITGNVIWGGTVVYAEEGLQQFNLDQMVVTATRTMKELQEVPSSVSVVTSQDIEERNINSVPEALQTLPGVYMNQAAQGGIQIRGFSSSDILVLLDGLPMNTTYNNGMEWEMVPVEKIARIEVVRGAGSSLYGGRAVGAVVNIITKDNPEKKGASVNAVVSYGSNNTWKKALYADARVNKKLSFGVGYENRKSDGYRGYYYTGSASKGSGGIKPDHELPQLSNGKYVLGGRGEKVWENENISANVKYDFDEDRSLKYTFIHTESEYRYQNPWTTIYKDGKPVFSGSVDVGNGQIVKPSIGTYLGYDGRKESDLHTLSYNDNLLIQQTSTCSVITSEIMHGNPFACASTSTTGNPSHWDGIKNTSIADIYCATLLTAPVKITASDNLFSCIHFSIFSLSSPSPTSNNLASVFFL